MRTHSLFSGWMIAALASVSLGQESGLSFDLELELSKYFHIPPNDASAADVEIVREGMRRAILRLQWMFGVERVDRLLCNVDCDVHVRGKANGRVDESTALLVTAVRNGRYTATIEVLAASSFSPTYRDVAGFDGGPAHQHKVLAHEYATVLLERITRDKPKGWSFFTAPPWFVQGYPEFLSLQGLPGALESFSARQSDPGRVRFQPQFQVKDPYIDGATLVHFLHESFGGERVRALLDAPEASFDEALEATLGASQREIEARWKKWRDRALLRLDWLKAVHAATSPQEVAEAVEGQDLARLGPDVRATVFDALRALAGDDTLWRTPQDGEPRRLYRVNAGVTRWVLLAAYSGVKGPKTPWMAAHPFGADWKRLPVTEFPLGRSLVLGDVWLERVDALSEPVLVVRLINVKVASDFAYRELQYYSVRDGRVGLVRKEREGYSGIRADYTAANPMAGPPPLRRTAGQWIGALSSNDPATVLEALTWLGGRHLASAAARRSDGDEESVPDSELWEAVRADPRTRERIKELSSSASRWVRQGAELVLQPEER